MQRHTAVTNTKRTFERHTRNAEGAIVRQTVTERVAVCDLYTVNEKGDTRVFHRGARVA